MLFKLNFEPFIIKICEKFKSNMFPSFTQNYFEKNWLAFVLLQQNTQAQAKTISFFQNTKRQNY
jgi:hypothetical protein